MKYKKEILKLSYLVVSAVLILSSCKKDNSASSNSGSTTAAVSSSNAIAVAAVTSLSSTSKSSASHSDSIYVMHTCSRGFFRDSISSSSLPASIISYLSANYTGYTFQSAYKIINRDSVVSGYVVIIQFNGNPVGLEFNSSGSFIRVLEQREGRDMEGRGWHSGGRFEDRDGKERDTISLSALPVAILSYITTNYPNDTLVAAYKNRDSSTILLTKNNGVFAIVFSSSGTFINRVQLQPRASKVTTVLQTALPAKVQSYLASTYPNYVFKKAFAINAGGTLYSYVVLLEANSTKYAVQFDASGNFVKSFTLR